MLCRECPVEIRLASFEVEHELEYVIHTGIGWPCVLGYGNTLSYIVDALTRPAISIRPSDDDFNDTLPHGYVNVGRFFLRCSLDSPEFASARHG